mmetsp:Transcript_4559/g.11704  ORF Transcript_4559/g.11704 Transcript_4559/m.11704 type:complete len:231 (-) Transcript_4559:691-1383(-)
MAASLTPSEPAPFAPTLLPAGVAAPFSPVPAFAPAPFAPALFASAPFSPVPALAATAALGPPAVCAPLKGAALAACLAAGDPRASSWLPSVCASPAPLPVPVTGPRLAVGSGCSWACICAALFPGPRLAAGSSCESLARLPGPRLAAGAGSGFKPGSAASGSSAGLSTGSSANLVFLLAKPSRRSCPSISRSRGSSHLTRPLYPAPRAVQSGLPCSVRFLSRSRPVSAPS